MATYRHAKGPSVAQILIIVLVVVLSIGIISGAAYAVYHFAFDKDEVTETLPVATTPPATFEQVATEAPTEDPELKYSQMAKDYMSKMTDDEKIYQMLMVTPETLTGVDVVTMAGDATKTAVETYPVGGIIYDADNFEDTQQTTDLIKNTQSFAKTPMFMAVAEEGGVNAPVASKLGTTTFENMSTYAQEGDKKAYENASTIAKDINKFGFNFNFAPVANIEGDSAYGTDANTVSPLIAQATKGFVDNKVISATKSFPAVSDTDKPAEELTANEFLPFTAAIQNSAGAIVVGNVKATAIDSENPAFMSQKLISELLIKDLKFNGVVMTSDLSDATITSNYTTEQIVTGSIGAGVNMFLTPSSIDEYVSAIKSALESGAITQQQIDNSVAKILTLKFKYGILTEATATPTEAATDVATEAMTEAETTIQ